MEFSLLRDYSKDKSLSIRFSGGFTAPRNFYNRSNEKEDTIMTWKQIQTSREIRQWIKGIIVPTILGGIYLDYNYPDLKYRIVNGVKSKFRRKEK